MVKITALDKKVLRDLGSMWAQALAIAMVIGAGVAMFVMSEGMLKSLLDTRAAYYERYGFAQVFAPLKRAPNSLSSRLEEVPGVRFVETRIKKSVSLDMPGLDEPAQGRVISYPIDPPRLNRLHLVEGRWFQGGRTDEVLVSEAFAKAYDLKPGGEVTVIMNGRREVLHVVGIVLSAEYVYTIPPGGLVPDNRRFGVLWLTRPALEAAFDMEGAFNDTLLALDPGAEVEDVKANVDRVLDTYGGIGSYSRERQFSNWFLTGEMNQLRNMSKIVPPIFLAIAAFLLNIVITRWIQTEREEIGLLKAFGYSTRAVGAHYLKLVLTITVVGIVLGFAGGIWLGRGLAVMYQEFFNFPFLYFRFAPHVFLIAGGVSLVAALVGTWSAVRRAAFLPPAEAMMPPPPTSYNRSRFERFFKSMSTPSRMVMRHIVRWPWRSLLTVLGNALAVAVLIGSMFFFGAIDTMIDIQFNRIERQDATLSFIETRTQKALEGIEVMPGVLKAEPFRAVTAKLRIGPAERRESIIGVFNGGEFSNIVDADFRPVDIPKDGLVLSKKLAEILGAGVGDTVLAQVTEGRRPLLELPVVQISETVLASPAFMDLEALNRLMQETGRMDGAYVRLDADKTSAFYKAVKNTPAIAGVAMKDATKKSFRDTMSENLLVMTTFNVLFAVVIAVGVVYNAARISLSERERELASLRVLGFTLGEVSYILLGELALLTVFALPLGCGLGYGLAWTWALSLDTDLYRIPLEVTHDTYGFAILVVLAAALVSGLLTFRRLGQLDMVMALKTRE